MNKLLLVALLAIVACRFSDKEVFQEFQKFQKKFSKKYSSVQELMARYRIFARNYKKVTMRNKKYQGVTRFMDMTQNEFRRKYLTLKYTVGKPAKNVRVKPIKVNAPDSWDWRDQGAVNLVKDQASCGSCWAFSTVGNLEGQYYLTYKESMTFSEQQLVDCDDTDSGCGGGEMTWAFEWIKNNGGLESDKDYPYVGYDDMCSQDESLYKVKVVSWEQLPMDSDPDVIRDYLYETGPLSIGLNADTLQFYSGGIDDSDEWDCDPDGINHGVTMIGYGEEDGLKYWICKNSWGDYWGEDGFFRMSRGKNTCGIEHEIEGAKVEKA